MFTTSRTTFYQEACKLRLGSTCGNILCSASRNGPHGFFKTPDHLAARFGSHTRRKTSRTEGRLSVSFTNESDMALSASYPPYPTTITPVSMDRLVDLRSDRHCVDMQKGVPKDVNCDMEHAAELISVTSSSTTPKGSISTDGGGSDNRRGDGSENGTDIAAPDREQSGNSSKVSAPADKRAEKRRMKRFRYVAPYHSVSISNATNIAARLTHNQTRYLMSEFTRQPHPDAAHRERLSREIPGLSPRQVQVWFQNR